MPEWPASVRYRDGEVVDACSSHQLLSLVPSICPNLGVYKHIARGKIYMFLLCLLHLCGSGIGNDKQDLWQPQQTPACRGASLGLAGQDSILSVSSEATLQYFCGS